MYCVVEKRRREKINERQNSTRNNYKESEEKYVHEDGIYGKTTHINELITIIINKQEIPLCGEREEHFFIRPN